MHYFRQWTCEIPFLFFICYCFRFLVFYFMTVKIHLVTKLIMRYYQYKNYYGMINLLDTGTRNRQRAIFLNTRNCKLLCFISLLSSITALHIFELDSRWRSRVFESLNLLTQPIMINVKDSGYTWTGWNWLFFYEVSGNDYGTRWIRKSGNFPFHDSSYNTELELYN